MSSKIKILSISILNLIFISCGKEYKSKAEGQERINNTKLYVYPNNDLENIKIGDIILLQIDPESNNNNRDFFDYGYYIKINESEYKNLKGLQFSNLCEEKFLEASKNGGCFKVTDDFEIKYNFRGSFYYMKTYFISKAVHIVDSDERTLSVKVKR